MSAAFSFAAPSRCFATVTFATRMAPPNFLFLDALRAEQAAERILQPGVFGDDVEVEGLDKFADVEGPAALFA